MTDPLQNGADAKDSASTELTAANRGSSWDVYLRRRVSNHRVDMKKLFDEAYGNDRSESTESKRRRAGAKLVEVVVRTCYGTATTPVPNPILSNIETDFHEFKRRYPKNTVDRFVSIGYPELKARYSEMSTINPAMNNGDMWEWDSERVVDYLAFRLAAEEVRQTYRAPKKVNLDAHQSLQEVLESPKKVSIQRAAILVHYLLKSLNSIPELASTAALVRLVQALNGADNTNVRKKVDLFHAILVCEEYDHILSHGKQVHDDMLVVRNLLAEVHVDCRKITIDRDTEDLELKITRYKKRKKK